MFKTLLFAAFMLLCSAVHGQIKFSTFTESDIVLTQLGTGILDFDWILANQSKSIELGDPEMVVLSITGVEYYDVIITIDAPAELVLDGENSMGFTLNAAFANRGQNQVSDARLINGDTARFQIKRDDGPPGPPPTPPHEGYTPPEATAYLYLYGTINVGEVDAGIYEGTVNITVEYD